MKKKILMMTQNFYPVIGSAGNRMRNIFHLLHQHKMDVDVLTIEPAYPNKNMYKDPKFWDDEWVNSREDNITRVQLKNQHSSRNLISRLFFYIEMMYRFLSSLWEAKDKKYDYILVSTPPIFIVFSAFIAKFLFMKKTKIILEVRDLWPDSLIGVKIFDYPIIIRFFRYLEKKMYQNADYIIINSIGFREHIERKLKYPKKIIYIPNGPRAHEIVKEKEHQEEFRVVYTGNIGLAQDVEHIKSIAKLLHENKITFHVIGYGVKAKEFQNYIKKNDLHYVHFQPPATRKESLKLIKSCQLGIAFLNDEEVFSTVLPGKIIDYMTCKTPIIAGVKGTAAKIISANQTGFAFNQSDVHAMVEKIVELKQNPHIIEEMGQNCIKTVEKEFLWEKNIHKLLQIIT